MATEDKRRQFDEIVTRLVADYPSLGRASRRAWSRPVLIALAALGAVAWGLLSVAMVAWGARGVVLACTVVALTAAAAAADSYRRRHGR